MRDIHLSPNILVFFAFIAFSLMNPFGGGRWKLEGCFRLEKKKIETKKIFFRKRKIDFNYI
jgi:hypothetical protein